MDDLTDECFSDRDVWGGKLDGLEREVADLPPPRRPALRARVAALRRWRRGLERLLHEAAHAPGTEWEEACPRLRAAVRELRALAADCSSRVGV